MTTGNGAMFGRYELRGSLGQGGFAEVYRGWDTALYREVAIKTLRRHLAEDASIRQRFLNEARAMARLHHPNIVTVHDVGEAEGRPFFAMDLVDGRSLAALAPAGERFDLARLGDLLGGVAAAIDYLHAEGLVHRDIKPANIMIDGKGRAMLMDFGISKGMDEEQLTQTGLSIGTPEYMAPEQIRGQPAGPAADIYALGVLAYRLLAGRAPFAGNTAAVLHGHASEPPPPLAEIVPGLPAGAYAAIAAALAKDPDDRPQSAAAFVDQLTGPDTAGFTPIRPTRAATQELDRTILAPLPAPSPAPAPKVKRRNAVPIILAAVAAVALAGGGAAVLLARGKSSSGSPVATAAVSTLTASPVAAGLARTATAIPAISTPAPTPPPTTGTAGAAGVSPTVTNTPAAISATAPPTAPPTTVAPTVARTAPPNPTNPPPTVPPATRPPVVVPTSAAYATVLISKKYGAALRVAPSSDADVRTVSPCGAGLGVVSEQSGWYGIDTQYGTLWVGGARVVPAGTAVDCRGAVTYQVGQDVTTQVASGCLSLRFTPSRDAGFTSCVQNGFHYRITGGPIDVNGEDWLPVTSASTGAGWVLAQFLLP